MKPLISVVIASYNHQQYIGKTLNSIENQTFQDFEIIIIDDGSSDGTVAAARKADSRAQIFTQENKGVVEARNRGIKLSSGKYICFIDSDDVIMPTRFEKQAAILEQNPDIGLVYSDAFAIDSEDNILGKFHDVYPVKEGDADEQLILHYCFIPIMTVMARTEILLKTGLFEKPGYICDYIKWIEIAHLSGCYYIPEPLGCWRRHSQCVSKTSSQERKYATIRVALHRILRRYPQLKAKIGKRINKRFSTTYFLSGFFLAANGDVDAAKKYYLKAFKIEPQNIRNILAVVFIHLPFKKLVICLHKKVKNKKIPW
jgi:glycosyltransferase involved in cell wall biosynthesis